MADDVPFLFLCLGTNHARAFGMEANDRACRLAANAGFECATKAQAGRPALLASLAYAWDPAWLKALKSRPKTILTFAGKPVIAHAARGRPIQSWLEP